MTLADAIGLAKRNGLFPIKGGQVVYVLSDGSIYVDADVKKLTSHAKKTNLTIFDVGGKNEVFKPVKTTKK